MYSLAIKNGDLSLEGDLISTVTGTNMVSQELNSWLIEPVNSNVYSPLFGSILDSFIGSIIDDESIKDIETEIYRVLNNYVIIYGNAYKKQMLAGTNAWNNDDIVKSITNVQVSRDKDIVDISIEARTLGDRNIVIQKVIS